MQKASRPQRKAFRDKYLAALSIVALLLCSVIGRAQVIQQNTQFGVMYHRSGGDSALYFPTGCGAPSGLASLRSVGFGNGEKKRMAAIYADTCGHHVYWLDWSDTTWKQIDGTGGSTDTTSLSNRINQKLNISDTATMLSVYLRASVAAATYYPLNTNPAGYLTSNGLPAVINALQVINAGGATSWASGTYAARPAAGVPNRFYAAIDSATIYFDNGSTWLTISGGGGTPTVVWGGITGTLSSQTDLQAALNAKLAAAANLSDLNNVGTARTNLGLGTAAVKDVPSSGDATSGQVVLGSDSRLAAVAGKLSSVSTTNSVTGDGAANPVKLVNDAGSPGNSKYYGTDGSGTKGYYNLPSASSQNTQQTFDQGSTLNKSNTIAYAGFTQNFTGGLSKFDSLRLGVIAAPLTKIGTLNGLGDSFRQPATGSTAPVDSSELAMLADTLRVQYNNLALSGSGVRYAIQQMDSTINGPFNTGITWVQAMYNDARAGGNNSRTPLKAASALKAGFVNHFADEYITGSDTTTAFLHRYGTWTTGLNSTTMGGKTKNGAQTTTLNDSITYDFVGRYAGVILKGGDGSAYITSIVRANIDGGSTTDYNTTVADGTTVVSKVNNEIPYAIVFDAGTWGKHHIKLVNTEAKIMYVDYFAPLSVGIRGPYIVNHMIYPVAPAGTQYLACNNAIDSAWALLPAAFPTWVVPVNNNFDRTTGLSGDGVHPNNTGYRQIFRAEMDQWNARAVGLQGVIVRDTTGLYYFDRGYRRLLEAAEAFTRSEAAYKFPSFVEIPANMAYRVGGIDIWKADVINKNYLIGNQAGIAITYGSGTGNIFAGDLAGTTCTTCSNNLALGTGAMQLSTTATANAAIGPFALQQNTTGGSNTAVGHSALKATATGSNNTGVGQGALILNTASNNTGLGSGAGAVNTSGTGNTYAGYQSGNFNATSNYNSGLGYQSIYGVTGAQNTGAGAFSLAFQTSGIGNAAMGYQAGYGNGVNGAFNFSVFHGYAAGKQNGTGGDFNIYIGDSTGVTASGTTFTGKRNIVIGNRDTLPSSSTNDFINIGHIFFGDRATGRASINNINLANSFLSLPASTTSYSSLNMPAGTFPSSPTDGDWGHTSGHLYFRDGSTTYDLLSQINFTAKNGTQLRTSDTAIIQGGAYDQDTYIGGGGFSKYEGTSTSKLDSFAVYANTTIVFNKQPVVNGSPLVMAYTWAGSNGNTAFVNGGTTADADAVYEINGWLLINSIATNTIKFQVSFTDHTNTVRTLDLFPAGTTTAAQSTTGYYMYPSFQFRAKSGTNLDFSVTGTSGGSMNYDYEITFKKLHL